MWMDTYAQTLYVLLNVIGLFFHYGTIVGPTGFDARRSRTNIARGGPCGILTTRVVNAIVRTL
jgi:hypothetical protein